jgi:hypothetical protein
MDARQRACFTKPRRLGHRRVVAIVKWLRVAKSSMLSNPEPVSAR